MSMKYRAQHHLKMMKRNKTNEYIREYLNAHQHVFLQGISGSGKTYTMFSFINEFYHDRYIYFRLDSTDNDINMFKQHLIDAFSYASLDVKNLSLDKPYIFVLDQLEVIENNEVLEYIRYVIEYIPNTMYMVIISKHPLPECFYELIQYHQLKVVDKCPLFFDKNETIRLHKTLHPKHLDPYSIYSYSQGWPLLVSYVFYQDHGFTGKDYILREFLDNLSLTDSQLYLLKIISLAPYVTIDLLNTLHIEHLTKDISYLYNISLVNNNNNTLTTIPTLKLYLYDKYKSDIQDILSLVYPYYIIHNYIHDILYCFDYIHQDKKHEYIMNHDLAIAEVITDIQLDDHDDIHTLYLKAVSAFHKSQYRTYKDIVSELKTYEKTDEVKTRLANLIYLSTNYKFSSFAKQKNKQIELSSVIGNYPSVMNGKRDLTTLYDYQYKDHEQYLKYKSLFNDKEQLSIKLGEIEYLFYINQTQKCLEEIEYFYSFNKEELSSDILAALSSLLFKMYYAYGLKDSAIKFYNDYRSMIPVTRNDILLEENMKLHDIYVYCLLNDKEKAYDWYREEKIDEEVRYDNYYRIYMIARVHYMMERYDQANYYFTKLESFFRQEKRTLYLAECLFANAACLLAQKNELRALHRVTEAFTVAGSYRYVFPFITYGKYGLEIMKKYRELMKNDEETAKKSYEYGILTKSYDQYLRTIIRECEKLIKVYPIIERTDSEALTVKETAVLKCITKGYTNKDISEELVISLPTVKTHISNIFSKLGVKNRAQAIAYVKENNLFDNL